MATVRQINPASLRNLRAYVNDLPKKVRDVGSKTIAEAANQYHDALKTNIEQQTKFGNVPPLSESWIKRKVDDRFWINHGDLLAGLEIRRVALDETRRSFIVGFNDQPHGRSTGGLTNAELAYILEVGHPLLKIPARPVVRPTWEDHRKTIVRVAKQSFKNRWKHDRYRG